MPTLEEKLERYDYLKARIEMLKVEIWEHERPENKRNYKFYVKGTELYKELSQLKVELAMARRVLEAEGVI